MNKYKKIQLLRKYAHIKENKNIKEFGEEAIKSPIAQMDI